MNNLVGELAALATSLFYAISAVIFSQVLRRIPAVIVNRFRLILAILFLILLHFILNTPLPWHVSLDRWTILGVSGVIGLAIGDSFLYKSYATIGPRLGMLIMSLSPAMAALLAWIFLAERLSLLQILGMLLALAGVVWVIWEKNGPGMQTAHEKRSYISGVVLGLGSAACQSIGLILTKQGLSGGFPAHTGTLIRMLAAVITLWLMAVLQGDFSKSIQAVGSQRGLWPLIILGSFIGPFLGVTASLIAVQNTAVGIASTLSALPPVVLLPISFFVFKERFGWQAVVGTVVAIAGVGILFLV